MNSESKNFQRGKSEPDCILNLVSSHDGDTALSRYQGRSAQRAHFGGAFQHRVDSNGQMSLWWDSSEEPPEPDDFKSVQEFAEAWEKSSPSTQISETTIQSQVQSELPHLLRQRSLFNESSTYISCPKCDNQLLTLNDGCGTCGWTSERFNEEKDDVLPGSPSTKFLEEKPELSSKKISDDSPSVEFLEEKPESSSKKISDDSPSVEFLEEKPESSSKKISDDSPSVEFLEEKPEPSSKKKPRGCLYRYLEHKKLKSGVIASYPRVDGARNLDNPKHWRWGFNWEEKIDGEWKGRSIGSIPTHIVPAIEVMQNQGIAVQEIIAFLNNSSSVKFLEEKPELSSKKISDDLPSVEFLEEKPELSSKKKPRGCLYRYLEHKKLKSGVIVSYPRVDGARNPDNPKHWRWGFNWEEKIDEEWKGRSIGSIPTHIVPAIEVMQNQGVAIQEIIAFIKSEKFKKRS